MLREIRARAAVHNNLESQPPGKRILRLTNDPSAALKVTVAAIASETRVTKALSTEAHLNFITYLRRRASERDADIGTNRNIFHVSRSR